MPWVTGLVGDKLLGQLLHTVDLAVLRFDRGPGAGDAEVLRLGWLEVVAVGVGTAEVGPVGYGGAVTFKVPLTLVATSQEQLGLWLLAAMEVGWIAAVAEPAPAEIE